MNITHSIRGGDVNLLSPRQLQAVISTWQVGQVLQALVVKQVHPQSVILQVNNQQLQADTNINLTSGQRLQLTVVQTGDKPVLQARLLDTPIQTLSPAQTMEQAVISLLKQSLPRQASTSTLLANIVWLTQHAGNSILPKPLLDLVKQLYQLIPEKNQITDPGQLKQNILNSGVFLENKLSKFASDVSAKSPLPAVPGKADGAAASTSLDKISADLKLTIMRLLTTVQQISRSSSPPVLSPQTPSSTALPSMTQPFTLPTIRGQLPQPQPNVSPTLAGLHNNLQLLLLEIGKQTDGALARTQLHQAASLSGSEQNTHSWAFELPIRNNEQIDIFDIVIDEEKEQNPDNHTEVKRQWTITMAFDLPGLGAVYTKLMLVDDKLSTSFWADHAETSQLFNRHLGELRQRYQQSGIETSEITCYQGKPADISSNLPNIVLDINA